MISVGGGSLGVKSLANQTDEATGDTSVQIAQIQSATREAVDAIEGSLARSKK
jgi:methyl-accepting chemotaxis protein